MQKRKTCRKGKEVEGMHFPGARKGVIRHSNAGRRRAESAKRETGANIQRERERERDMKCLCMRETL